MNKPSLFYKIFFFGSPMWFLKGVTQIVLFIKMHNNINNMCNIFHFDLLILCNAKDFFSFSFFFLLLDLLTMTVNMFLAVVVKLLFHI